ncbi:hypothetical protein [Luteolibacter algae]|uniref:hypothetical protein n=1 Tax=Luteolibacter algae TaxID=454151 RepID=UPI0036DF0DD6
MPSLEALPFFDDHLGKPADCEFSARSSYGSIARDMLVGTLGGGILPWEIFAHEILALPGQRNQWNIPLFPSVCPIELVLQAALYKGLYSRKSATAKKLPPRLVIGIESRSSLTRSQFFAWLMELPVPMRPKIAFQALPMDLMLQAMASEVIDGFVAPAPWGLVAEGMELGIVDGTFTAGAYAQDLVLVSRNELELGKHFKNPGIPEELTLARRKLETDADFLKKCALRMQECGKPLLSADYLERAIRRYKTEPLAPAQTADTAKIGLALRRLEELSSLPPQIAANDRTARLLVSL